MNDLTRAAGDRAMRGARWPWLAGGAACALFAVSAAAYSFALRAGARDLWSLVQAALTSDAYTYGPQSSAGVMRPVYSAQIVSVAVHTLGGAIAFLAAMTQFVPAIRHRMPRLHRATGALVVFLVLVMTFASLWMLGSRPLDASFSGEVFSVGLASLGGLTLLATVLAALAVRARKFRVHMGWMALMFACLLTAPVMRIGWVFYGWFTRLPMETANLAIAVYLLPACLFIMSVWMRRVGERDLGAMPVRCLLPPGLLRPVSLLAAFVALHEGVFAPYGLDIAAPFRAVSEHLAVSGGIWGLCTASVAYRAPDELARLERGEPLTTTTLALASLAGIGAIGAAASHAKGDSQAIAQAAFFLAWGVEFLALNMLGRRARGAGAAWDAQWLTLSLAPALWPLLALVFAPLGLGASGATTAAYMDAYAVSAALGFASAFGLRIVVGVSRNARVAVA